MTQSVKSDRIAKLLATEDVTVRHSTTAKTASFDTNSRVLTLPVYLVKNDNVHDMMTGHEVGHALWTKSDDWLKALVNDYDKDILNVVEDARIEKKIKTRYPGIVRNFIEAYKILADKKFFYDDVNTINEMQFIDRVNLHFKCGMASNVRFYAEEKPLVEMVANCNTWKDVLKTTRAIMEFTVAQFQEEEHQEMLEDGFEDSIAESEDVSEMSNEELEDTLQENNFSSETQERFDESAEKMTEGNKEHGYKKPPKELLYGRLPKANLNNIVVSYKEILSNLQMDLAQSSEIDRNKSEVVDNLRRPVFEQLEDDFVEFRKKTSRIVNYMVKEFERKKAAKEYRKESISKTGVLDVNKLFSYKYNDDVFLKNIIKPDGKNHGMVFLLDWSASMNRNIGVTVNQLLTLVWFCKKVNVPFEVYGFTTSYGDKQENRYNSSEERFAEKVGMLNYQGHNIFNLLQFFSTKMNAQELNAMSRMIYQFAHGYRDVHTRKLGMGSTPLIEGLGCMTEILPMIKNNYNLDIVNLFVLTDGDGNSKIYGVYNGESTEDYNKTDPVGDNLIIENPATKKSHDVGELGRSLRNQGSYHYNNSWVRVKGQEYAILKIIKEIPGINIIGIFLDGDAMVSRYNKRIHDKFMPSRRWSEMKQLHIEQRKEMKKFGFTTHKWMAYDAFYIIPTSTIRELESELEITSDMKASQMKRIFGKHQKTKWESKVFVNRLMEIIC